MMAIAMLNKNLKEFQQEFLKKKNYFTKQKTRQAFQTNSMRPVLLIRNHKHTKNIQEEKKTIKQYLSIINTKNSYQNINQSNPAISKKNNLS